MRESEPPPEHVARCRVNRQQSENSDGSPALFAQPNRKRPPREGPQEDQTYVPENNPELASLLASLRATSTTLVGAPSVHNPANSRYDRRS